MHPVWLLPGKVSRNVSFVYVSYTVYVYVTYNISFDKYNYTVDDARNAYLL